MRGPALHGGSHKTCSSGDRFALRSTRQHLMAWRRCTSHTHAAGFLFDFVFPLLFVAEIVQNFSRERESEGGHYNEAQTPPAKRTAAAPYMRLCRRLLDTHTPHTHVALQRLGSFFMAARHGVCGGGGVVCENGGAWWLPFANGDALSVTENYAVAAHGRSHPGAMQQSSRVRGTLLDCGTFTIIKRLSSTTSDTLPARCCWWHARTPGWSFHLELT